MKLLKFKNDYEYDLFTKNIGGEEVKFFLFRIKDIRKKFSKKEVIKLHNLSSYDTPIVNFKYEYKCKHYNFLTPLWIRRELDCNCYGTVIKLLDMKTYMSELTNRRNMCMLATSYPRDDYIDDKKHFDRISINTFIPYTNISIVGHFIKNTELESYDDIPDFDKAYLYMDGVIHYNDG